MGNYDNILVPVGGQPVSSSQFGVPVRDAIRSLDLRVTPLETQQQRIVRRYRRITSSGAAITTTETPYIRLDNIPIINTGIYRISTSNLNLISTVVNDIAAVRCRVATGVLGTLATIASTQIGDIKLAFDVASAPVNQPLQCFYVSTADTYLSVLLSIVRLNGTGNIQLQASATAIAECTVEYAGVDPGNVGTSL